MVGLRLRGPGLDSLPQIFLIRACDSNLFGVRALKKAIAVVIPGLNERRLGTCSQVLLWTVPIKSSLELKSEEQRG